MANPTATSHTGKPVTLGDECTILGTITSSSGNNLTVKTNSSGTSITVPFKGSANASHNVNGPSLSGAGKTFSGFTNGEQVVVKGRTSSVGTGGFTASINVLLADGTTTVTVKSGDVHTVQNA
jgi:hypothetical protein